MTKHLLRRLAGMVLVLLAVSFITYAALAAAPGDTAAALVGDSASAEQLAVLRQQMGLDRPLLARYADFAAGLLCGDLGQSLVSGRSVADLLLERLPYTLILALAAILLALVIGIVGGTLAALRAGSIVDTALMGGAVVGLAVPTFWSSLLLIMFFSLKLRWLPVVGAGSLKHLVLPTLTLALPTAAIVGRLMRASLLDVMGADYVRTAQGKGLSGRQVLGRHIMRNSLIPLITVMGVHLGHLLGGSFVVETIFGWPGLGRLTVLAIFDRDYPVVLGAALTVAAIYLFINLLVDLGQAWLDPRVAQKAI